VGRTGETWSKALTKIRKMEKPIRPPAKRGDQYDIEGYDVHPNQKKEIANNGAANSVDSRRASGGTLAGAYSLIYRSYRGSKKIRYCKDDQLEEDMAFSREAYYHYSNGTSNRKGKEHQTSYASV